MNESAARNAVHADVDALIAFWSLDGRIVRTIISGWDGWRANLYRLAVDPGLRGRGLGRTLLAMPRTGWGGSARNGSARSSSRRTRSGRRCGGRPATGRGRIGAGG